MVIRLPLSTGTPAAHTAGQAPVKPQSMLAGWNPAVRRQQSTREKP